MITGPELVHDPPRRTIDTKPQAPQVSSAELTSARRPLIIRERQDHPAKGEQLIGADASQVADGGRRHQSVEPLTLESL